MNSSNRKKPTRFGEGPQDADIMMVGQNPGKEEVKQGRPFVGRAGQYLNKVLEMNGLDRGKLFLTAVVKEPTPGNRKPKAKEIERWMPSLVAEIKEVKPEVIVLMGKVAWKTPRFQGIDYIETYHPAAGMRFPKIRKKFEKDIQKLTRKIKRENIAGLL
ncbi:MAG: uracil-DNA glycosylase [Thermodesulfobacteriota bacterium]